MRPTWAIRAAAAIPERIAELVAAAFAEWAASGYRRAGDDEVACTVRVFAELERITADTHFLPVFEAADLTVNMKDGTEHPRFAGRTDISVYVLPPIAKKVKF